MSHHEGFEPNAAEKEIIDALAEFRDVLASGAVIEDKLTVRRARLDLSPRPYTGEGVRATRGVLKASQGVFARLIGVSAKTVSSWEQGERKPSAMARRFFDEINHAPDYWARRLADSARPKGVK